MRIKGGIAALVVSVSLVVPSLAQITVLDQAQDAPAAAATGADTAAEPAAPPPPCGTEPISIARMGWSSAALLAEIHARLLSAHFACEVRVIPGDLAATASSMGSTGQPAAAPEMWVTRIADVWNGALDGQQVRSAAPAYDSTVFEGWFLPAYAADPAIPPRAADLAQTLQPLEGEGPIPFISCPIDWACSVINRNLVRAHGLSALVEIVEPANRFEMDRLIAEAVNRKQPFLFYYWQPNAVLDQLDFVPVEMGPYSEEAMKCLAERDCAQPRPSAFASEVVVTAVGDWVFAQIPAVAAYFQRATMPLTEMDALLAQLNLPEASVESVADRFVAEREEVWRAWVGATPPGQ